MHGTIVDISAEGGAKWMGVNFDELTGGHDCNGKCPQGHGYYLLATNLRHFPNNEEIESPIKIEVIEI
jgi:hypothetical protein